MTSDDRLDPSVCRVLIVDDIAVNRTILEQLLRGAKAQALSAPGAEEAFEILKSEPIDVVLMDLRMPQIDGVEAARRIRRDKFGGRGDVPIVAVSADITPRQREECRSVGINAFLAKPVMREDLIRILGDATGRALETTALDSGVAQKKPDEAAPTGDLVFDHKIIESIRGAAPPDRLIELLSTFRPTAGGLAGAIAAALEDDDRPKIRAQAHALKGTAASVGLSKMAACAQALQVACDEGDDEKLVEAAEALPSIYRESVRAIDGAIDKLKRG
ncbi:MAG: response regulator [Alphaproteobacteria bacterium]|nr:response regulator [Alphaproteobacteria bacterium]